MPSCWLSEKDCWQTVCAGNCPLNTKLFVRSDFEAGVPETTDLVLVLHDAWNPSVHQKAEEVLRPTGIPWLRGFVSFGEGVIGPLVRPDTPGCSQCADMRRLMAGRDRKEMWELQQRLEASRRNVAVMHGHRVRDFCRWLT